MNQVTLEEFNNLLNLKDDNNEDEDVCLISHETLTENNIKLYCGHCFNYEPLLNEIKYQKVFIILIFISIFFQQIRCHSKTT